MTPPQRRSLQKSIRRLKFSDLHDLLPIVSNLHKVAEWQDVHMRWCSGAKLCLADASHAASCWCHQISSHVLGERGRDCSGMAEEGWIRGGWSSMDGSLLTGGPTTVIGQKSPRTMRSFTSFAQPPTFGVITLLHPAADWDAQIMHGQRAAVPPPMSANCDCESLKMQPSCPLGLRRWQLASRLCPSGFRSPLLQPC